MPLQQERPKPRAGFWPFFCVRFFLPAGGTLRKFNWVGLFRNFFKTHAELLIFCNFAVKNIKHMTAQLSNETYRKVHFAVMAIEASAKREKISGKKMHDRLKLQDLIHKRLFRYYDQLHTQSLEWVVDDTVETLNNWEQEAKEENL